MVAIARKPPRTMSLDDDACINYIRDKLALHSAHDLEGSLSDYVEPCNIRTLVDIAYNALVNATQDGIYYRNAACLRPIGTVHRRKDGVFKYTDIPKVTFDAIMSLAEFPKESKSGTPFLKGTLHDSLIHIMPDPIPVFMHESQLTDAAKTTYNLLVRSFPSALPKARAYKIHFSGIGSFCPQKPFFEADRELQFCRKL